MIHQVIPSDNEESGEKKEDIGKRSTRNNSDGDFGLTPWRPVTGLTDIGF
ncbi:MAG: hypothetical protein ABJQ14_09480 [Hyphomicrobiales bacterium]